MARATKRPTDAEPFHSQGRDGRILDRGRLVRARIATLFAFFLTGYMLYVWSTGTAAFRIGLGLDGPEGDRFFGFVVIGVGLGSVVGAAGIGFFVDRFGPRIPLMICLLAYPLSILPLGFAPSVTFAVISAVLLGLLRGGIDSAMNAHGVEVERHYGRPLMAGFHAFYPLGGTVAGLLGSWLVSFFADSVWVNFVVLAGGIFVIALLMQRWLLSNDEILPVPQSSAAPAGETKRSWGGWKSGELLLMVGLGILALSSMLSEVAIADWGQTLIIRELAADLSTAGLAVTLFTAAQFVARLICDRVTEWLGQRWMVFCSAALATAGAILLFSAWEVWVAMTALVIMGLGTAAIVPLMLSAAGRTDPVKNGRNISVVNGLGYAGTLVGPIGITALVEALGIQYLPLLMCVLFALIALAGPLLMRRTKSFRDTQVIPLPVLEDEEAQRARQREGRAPEGQ